MNNKNSTIQIASKKKLNIKYHGNNVSKFAYKGNFTRDEIQDYANKISKELKAQGFNGAIGVSLNTVDGYKGAMFRPTGENVRMYSVVDSPNMDGVDQQYYPSFNIFLMDGMPRYGGKNDKHNDCLWEALHLALQDKCPWKAGCYLKKYLKLERDALISIDDIPKIEEKLKSYKIVVTGDHIYNSSKDCLKEIHLKLIDGHYKLDQSKKTYDIKFNFKEKKPMICFLGSENVETYDGKEKNLIPLKEYYRLSKRYDTPYIYVPVDRARQNVQDRKTIEEEYNLFIERANLLKKKSKGLINLYKSGTNRMAALNLFDKYNKTIFPDDIKQDEAYWIEQASYGALIRSEPYKGPAHKYDVVSMYPSIMKNSHFLIPIKRGEFKLLEDFPETMSVGIYRVEIEFNEDVKKLFRYNDSNYYTHHDIRNAQSFGLNVKLIQDGKPNALIYTRDKCITGNQIFSEFVDVLFKMKQEGIKDAKPILNILWGALCEYKTTNKTIKKDDKTINIDGDNYIREMMPMGDDILLKLYSSNRVYKFNFARMAPFLLAKGRLMISNICRPFKNDIVRIHTDGFLIKNEINSKLIGTELGQLKYEGYSEKCIVKNNVHYEFN